ncbi:uncharacterized protein LOC141913175 [Tubulanus polymorphus]|uniref:uncharacterized protein LOC141913175 n=1 Tax=Tubulanus polymorphus TaxID=672921 RepID=UPI003DA4A1B5
MHVVLVVSVLVLCGINVAAGVECYRCASTRTEYGINCWKGDKLDKIAKKVSCRYKCLTIYATMVSGERHILRGCGGSILHPNCREMTGSKGDTLNFCTCIGHLCNNSS